MSSLVAPGWSPCRTVVAHAAHEWRNGVCPGITPQQETANAMRRKEAIATDWFHMVKSHGLTRLGQRQYQANRALWEQVHAKLHEADHA
jgi:hypothetical protein